MISLRWFFQIVLLLLAAIAVPQAFAGDGIVGTWKLVSLTSEDPDTGELSRIYGEHPHGQLIYTPGGHMMATLTADGRRRVGTNRFTVSVADQAEAYRTANAYAGTYTLTDTGVIHHVEVASIESWVGSDQVRFTKLDGNLLTIKTPPIPTPPEGKPRAVTLVWERSE